MGFDVGGDAPSARDWIAQGAYFAPEPGHSIFFHRVGEGPPTLLLHGFPTWSYDYAEVAMALRRDFDVIAPDFLGYGASAKPKGRVFSVGGAAQMIEDLVSHLGLREAHLVIHDYGAIVGQELLDRRRKGALSFKIGSVVLMNCSIPFSHYRPTATMKLLMTPLLGSLAASRLTKEKIRAGLNSARGRAKLSESAFEELWRGIAREGGHKISHRLLRYNRERARHAPRWEEALFSFEGRVKLIWGVEDPVSGAHVLEAARSKLPRAEIAELPGVGHFPPSEAPARVASEIRAFL